MAYGACQTCHWEIDIPYSACYAACSSEIQYYKYCSTRPRQLWTLAAEQQPSSRQTCSLLKNMLDNANF